MCCALSNAWAGTEQLDETMIKAMAGDYQAQRNLAYGYAAWPFPGQKKDHIRACAWYWVIKQSKHRQYNAGDEGNVTVYCGALNASGQGDAQSLAGEYMRAIAKTKSASK
jgi:hypothetical protein